MNANKVNKRGKTGDFFQKTLKIKGKFKPRLGFLKDQQGSILSDQEDNKKKMETIYQRTELKR